MIEIELLNEINTKLGKLVALTAIQGKKEEQQITILKSLGLTYKEISDLTGIPEGTLKSRDHNRKKKK